MQQLRRVAPDELLLRPPAELAQRAVRAQQRAVGRREHEPDGGALERAREALLGFVQCVPGAHALGDVAQHAGEAAPAALAPAAERQLERELAAVRAQSLDLDGRAHQPPLAGGEVARHARAVCVAVALGHQVRERPPQRLGRRVPEDRLGAGVPEDDPPVDVGGDDAVARRVGDRAVALLGGAQLLLAALARRDVLAAEEHQLVGGRVAGAEHEPAVGAVAAAQPQLGLRALARVALEQRELGLLEARQVVRVDEAVIRAGVQLLLRPAQQRVPRGVRPDEAAVGRGRRAEQVVRHRRQPPRVRLHAGRRVAGGGGVRGRRHRRIRLRAA
jgi:hypothetical protein